MKKRTLGQNLEVSALGLGCMGMSSSFPPFPEKQEMVALIRTAVGAAGLARREVEAELGRDHDPVTYRLEGLADELLVREWTISFSRVEHRHAAFDRRVDQSDGVLAVGGGTVGPRQSHAAVPDRRRV